MSMYKETIEQKTKRIVVFLYYFGRFAIILGSAGVAIFIAQYLGYKNDWIIAQVAFIVSILVGTFL